ncbi:MAG: glycosyltransferase [Leptolyngbyaceae cyanobacterium RU_5_1]|nr:glycosyltransferase [Leptolyngbyaceae cyanobacterium RU_5_1]
MNVLHVIPSVAPVRGGPSQAVLEMVKALRSQGINAEIATTNDNGPGLLEVPLRQTIEYQGVPVCFFPRYSPNLPAIREFAFSKALTDWLWTHISDYDLVHVHAIFSYPSTAAMAIARLRNIPYLVRPLGQLCTWSLQQSALKKQVYLQLVERANLNHCRALHFTTAQEQQEAAHLGLTTSGFVLPHGLDLPEPYPDARSRLRQKLGVAPDEPIVLFLSRLHAKKGLDYLLPALGKLRAHQFTFILAGNGTPDYEAEVDQLIEQHGLRDRTYRSGFIAGEEKNVIMQGADIFALTSHSENFGIAVLEAIAAGLRVVTTPHVPLAAMIQHHQLGEVVELEVTAIAQALENALEMIQDREKNQERINLGRQIVTISYTWEQIAAQLAEIYHGMALKL